MSVEDACTSLIEALDARRTDIVKTLLDHLRKNDTSGTSLKTVLASNCTKHGTLLHYAVHNNLNDALRALLIAGADPGARNEAGKTVIDVIENDSLLQIFADELLRAVAASELERTSTLISAGVKENVYDSVHTKNSALHWAASFGTENVIQLLVDNEFDVNAVNSDGCTPLHDAIQRKDAKIVKILLDAGADITLAASSGKLKGKTPRDLAMKNEQLKFLFSDGDECSNNVSVNGDQSDAEDKSPLTTPYNTSVIPTTTSDVVKARPTELKNSKLNLLWPRPKHVHELPGEGVTLPPHLQLVVAHPVGGVSVHSLLDVWQVYRQDINNVGYSLSIKTVGTPGQCSLVSGPGHVEVGLSANMVHDQYTLTITCARTRVLAGGLAGLHYACQTLLQILWIFKTDPIPPLVIRDRPSMSVRGVLVDLAAYGRLPTMDTFNSTVRSLAKLKMNQIHLFIRLAPHSEWQLSFLANDLISLDRECHDRLVRVYPTLDIIQPCSYTDLQNYTAAFCRIVACFSSRDKVHLGPCLSAVILSSAAQLGPTVVFSSLSAVLSVGPETVIVLCSNSLSSHTGLMDSVPSNIVFIEYGFQADYPFYDNILNMSSSGCDQIVCAGTSSWGCLVGRPGNMIKNVISSVSAASLTSVSGLVVASWAGSPSLAPLASSLPGWTLGLGLSWNSDSSEEFVNKHLGEVMTKHLFCDETGSSGQLLLELGKCEESVELPKPDNINILQSSLPLSTIMRPDGVDLENTDQDQLGKVIQEVRRSLAKLQVSREGGGGVGEGLIQEIALSGELLLLSARLARGLMLTQEKTVASLQPTFRTDLANK